MKHLLILSVVATLALTACKSESEAGKAVEAAANAATEAASEAVNDVKDVAAGATAAVVEGAEEATKAVVEGAENVAENVTETAEKAVDKAADVVAGGAYETDQERLGYAFGHQFAKNLVAGDLKDAVSADALSAAIKDSLDGKEPRMTQEEMRAAVEKYQTDLQAKAAAAAEENKAKGEAFLAENKGKDGVVTTESGLQYKVIEEGKGASPTEDKSVEVNYKGTLVDGTVFDSSYDRGQSATFPLNGVIPGFTEGLKLMKEGGKYVLYIPSDLAYGVQAPPTIGSNQTLIFEVELIAVK